MNSDKAYLLGLSVGGGIWANDGESFRIRLPFKQWGSYSANPQRAGQISSDILRVVGPMFREIYGLGIQYEATSTYWDILCEGDLSDLRSDFMRYHIPCEGEMRKNMVLDGIVADLIDANLKRRFIAGLADTIGSTNPNHRRFSSNFQILSFEIKGYNFDSVCSLCKLLHSIGCYPDQILWNHPNFHCSNDPYNMQWKKGFKLRVLSDQYEQFGAFAFTSKALSVQENIAQEDNEQAAEPCETRALQACRPTCYHPEENSPLLPAIISGGHYLHNRHVCAVLGCKHAPYAKIREMIDHAPEYVNPFPILSKGTIETISSRIAENALYSKRNYSNTQRLISEIREDYLKNPNALWGGNGTSNGYPVNIIYRATNFLICAAEGNLNGLRPKGNADNNINGYILRNPGATVSFITPDLLTPLIVKMGNYAAMIGPCNPELYRTLITISPSNAYKISMREITENDLAKKSPS